MLTSLPFLERIEVDPDPTSTVPHPVAPYEMASRLSYFLWSTMPDSELFAAAGSASLVNDATLQAEVVRMLADPRANNFVRSFAGQWLGARGLASHVADPTVFPRWSETLQQAMAEEMYLYFAEFLNGNEPWTDFLTAQIHFVNGPLAAFYGFTSIPASQTVMTKVVALDPNRVGFLGLAGWLASTSYPYRTAPTLRGKWVLQLLLDEAVPSPPPGEPPLDPSGTPATLAGENVRARLLAHRTKVSCAACHSRLDPIGLALENFDGIGQYRTTYGDGSTIDPSGELADGTMITGAAQLATILSSGARLQELTDFTAHQVMTYALGRDLSLDPTTGTDIPYLTQIQTQWAAQGYQLQALIEDVVLDQTFRLRHGGTP